MSELFQYLLALGDDHIILGHRLSEWCGHAPMLEEDIALANIALDHLGQGELFLSLAAKVEGKGQDADRLAFFRDPLEFRNCLLVEQPRGDFALTVVRNLFIDQFDCLLFEKLQASTFSDLGAISAKALQESKYHLRHSSEWIVRLGDGTDESHERTEAALAELWRYTAELFEPIPGEQSLVEQKVVPDRRTLEKEWRKQIDEVLKRAKLTPPNSECFMLSGGRKGHHSEHIGHLLAEMQILPRSYPDAVW